jgi:hypothetical protein
MSAHRADRRRAARAWAKHVETLGAEAGGAYRLQVFFPENILPTILEAREPQQIRALTYVNQFLCKLRPRDASGGNERRLPENGPLPPQERGAERCTDAGRHHDHEPS